MPLSCNSRENLPFLFFGAVLSNSPIKTNVFCWRRPRLQAYAHQDTKCIVALFVRRDEEDVSGFSERASPLPAGVSLCRFRLQLASDDVHERFDGEFDKQEWLADEVVAPGHGRAGSAFEIIKGRYK